MMLGVLLCAALGAVSPNGPVCDDLWFFADFDSVPRMGGDAFTARLPDGGDVKGRFGKGYAFVSDEKRCENLFWTVQDPERLKDFPFARGAFACWFRSPERYLDRGASPGFGYCGFWKFEWVWSGGGFTTAPGRGKGAAIKGFARSTEWRHFAAVWNAEKLVLYLDRQPVAEKANPELTDMSTVPRRVLRIGTGYDGSPAANLEMDEIAIFRRDLTADEVKGLATAKAGLFAGHPPIVADRIEFPYFWRDQADAALRTRLHAERAVDGALLGEIGDEPVASRTVRVKAGETKLAVPFDPSRMKAGKYPWHLRLAASDGRTLWERSGELEVRPRLDRDAFKFVNWGGWKAVPHDYLRTVGINAPMAGVFDIGGIRRAVAAGFFPNIRYENNKKYRWSSRDLDPKAVAAATDHDFAALEGLHVWTATLINSEIYGSGYPQGATNQTKFLAWARQELGFAPDFSYRNAPIEVNPKTVGTYPKGIIRKGDCPQLDTLRWVMARGMAPYRVGAVTAEAIHALDPENIVWSEPAFEGIVANLDMLADWHYQHLTTSTLSELRDYYAYCRPYGKPYMPTLGGGYSHGRIKPGLREEKRPKKGSHLASEPTQSADEIAIKAWMSISAVPAHALSFYLLDAWSEGEKAGLAEPGTGERFGRMWYERIAPAAELLQDMPNERAPLAIVRPTECRFTCGLGWGQVHYPGNLCAALAKVPVPFDVVYDRELESGALKEYRYAALIMAKTLYADHVERLDEAAKAGCRIVTDSYAVKRFDGGVHLDKLDYHYHPDHWHEIGEKFMAWYSTVIPELKNGLTAWSEGDGTNAFTFAKALDGVKYVTVINNLRSDEPGFLNECVVSNDWYRPYGAPQRIVTHLNVPKDAAVYEFNGREGFKVSGFQGSKVSGAREVSLTCDYGPAEGKVFCVYPKPLARLVTDVKDGFVRIALVDEDGRPAPGRQVVAVEVRDPGGTLHDETGRYVMNGGRVKIPLRFARDDADGTWQVNVKELTTGFAAKASWHRK